MWWGPCRDSSSRLTVFLLELVQRQRGRSPHGCSEGPFTDTHTLARTQPFQLRGLNAGALLGLPGVGHVQLCLLSPTQQALSLSVCRKLDGPTRARPRASSAWQSPRSTSGAWATRRSVLQRVAWRWAALAEVPKMPSSRCSVSPSRFAPWFPAPGPLPPHTAATQALRTIHSADLGLSCRFKGFLPWDMDCFI